MSRFFCLCIDDFPAWAEAYLHPALRDHPLLVRAGGTVIATSAHARAAGIQAGYSLARAYALLPTATILPFNPATTDLVGAEILSVFYGLTPVLEPLHPALSSKTPPRPGRLLASLHRPAAVRELLRDWTAYGCAVRGGIADDRTTAELAALTAAPGMLHSIARGQSRAFLRRAPLGILEHVGVSTESIERLGWFGWTTVNDLRKLTRRQLVDQFPEGELLFRYAAANDVRPLAAYTPPPELCNVLQFETPAQEPGEWEPALEHLLGILQTRLEGRTTRAITVGLEEDGGWRRSRQLLRAPLDSLRSLREAAFKILSSLLPAKPAVEIRGLEVRLGSLAQPQPVQAVLFEAERKVDTEILRGLEARFPGTLKRAVLTNPAAYLPEDAFLYEPRRLVPTDAPADISTAPAKQNAVKPNAAKQTPTKPNPAKPGPAQRSPAQRSPAQPMSHNSTATRTPARRRDKTVTAQLVLAG